MKRERNLWAFLFLYLAGGLWGEIPSYSIHPVLDKEDAYVKVNLQTRADSEGNATLVYLNQAWGEEDLFECLSSIKVLNTGARLRAIPEQNKIYIKALPSELLTIEYVLKQDFDGLPSKQQYYRPIINSQYFHLFGHRLFIIPETLYRSESETAVRIEISEEYEQVHHSLSTYHSDIFHVTRDELLESIFVGGDFRKETVEVNGIVLQLLTRGKWKKFSDFELLEEIQSIVNVQRSFWKDYADDIYTVTLLPVNADKEDYIGGTGLSSGFASYCSNSKISRLEDLTTLYYHEVMHHWIGGKMKMNTHYEELWFSEGFTEYFTHYLMRKEGLIDDSQFIREVEAVIKEHQACESKDMPNAELFLTSTKEESDIEKVPYRRGFLYALYLEKKLAKETEASFNLTNLLHKCLADCKNQRFSNEYFRSILIDVFGEKEAQFFDHHILLGEPIPVQLILGDS